ncbi:MAG TPA: hypothetical protein VL119_10895, partial [Acidimicrobiia bacterium]|nr:hypothetical protein [Acidimicrobiia bacterium]
SVQQSFSVATGVLIDQSTFVDGHGAVTTPAFSTSAPGDVLVAFVGADGPSAGGQTATVTGAGLTWTLVKRTNTRGGTSEIWQATAAAKLTNVTVSSTTSATPFDQSLVVVAFSGSSGVGASATASSTTGAPTISLTTTKAGSWVFAVGNDWAHATARTLAAGQTMVHQFVDTGTGDTYWTQSLSAPTAASGTGVTLADTAPTADRWNFTAVEVLSAP